MTGKRINTIQIMTAGFAVIWGLYAINPYSDLFSTYPALYAPMRGLVHSETFWGVLFGGGGIIAGYYALTKRSAFASLILGCMFISFAVLYFFGSPESPGGGLFGWVGMVNLIFYATNRECQTRH